MNTETFDFGHGPVPAHRHQNPDGTVGGWVADSATVDPKAFVGANARVGAGARVDAGAWVGENALVNGDDSLTGFLGGYRWTIYRTVEGWHIQYGCEVHPIDWWRTQDLPALSVRHGRPAEHARFTAFVLAHAEGLALLTNPPQSAPSPE